MNERSVTTKAASAAWLDVLKAHKLTPVEKISVLNGQKTSLCFLKKGPITVRGAGKGRTLIHNNLSARYEALEYYLSGINFNSYPVTLSSQIEIAKKANVFPLRCCPDRFLSKSNHSQILPWVMYNDIKDKNKYAVPLAAVDLSYELKKHKKDTMDYVHSDFFCVSNGLASGSTFEDALIHSVLEVIERDAYSYFLIDTFLLHKKVMVINHASLPKELLTLVSKLEKAFSDKLMIIKMPSRFDVPVYCAMFMGCEFENRPRGTGASLNPVVAIERAIHESVQSYNLMHNDYLSKDLGRRWLLRYKLVKNAVIFPIKKLFENKKIKYINFECSDFNQTKNTRIYADILINKVYKLSKLLINIPYKDKKVVCVRSIIPDAEEFFLISYGFKMYPNATTQKYIKKQSGKVFGWNGMR